MKNDFDGMACAVCGQELAGGMYALVHYYSKRRAYVLQVACSEEHLRDYLSSKHP